MEEEYPPKKIESKWQKRWNEEAIFLAETDSDKKKYYCLEMYPYPSGKMHMGHVRNYSIGDAVARYRRVRGYNVIYPMGFDSFGMPAENAAIKEGGHPREITNRNIANIKEDFSIMGFSHDWNREVMSHDPNYFKWNQWFFLKFLEKGLAYRTFANVNWCEDCNTVLANEQVHNGRCWRCSSEVGQKDMDQWFLRITDYAQELLDSLDDINFPDHVKALQRDWLGRSEGALIKFPVEGGKMVIETFTTRPDTIFGVTFITLAPENPLCENLVAGHENESEWRELRKQVSMLSDVDRGMLKEKKGVFLGRYAVNPINGEKIPIFAGNFVIASYGTGSVMAVPAHDQRDYEFAVEHNLPIRKVLIENDDDNAEAKIEKAFEGYGTMVNSSREGFNGLFGDDAKRAVIETLENEKYGNGMVQWKLRDWLISRQRYWGTPIPIIHCEECGPVPVPEGDLPVLLPDNVTFTWEGNPIESSPTFSDVACPNCGKDAKRETDTMDTFVDSSWYFMRYTDANNNHACFSEQASNYWMNVDFYCGGIEHAQMHLIYARFWTKALRDLGLHTVDEPFKELLCQGMVNAQAPYCKTCNVTHPTSERGNPCPHCARELTERSAKMSKSLGNTVSPISIVEKFGADTVRLFILFTAQPTAGMDWSDTAVEACNKQMKAIWNLALEMLSWSDDESAVDSWLTTQFQVRKVEWITAMEGVNLRAAVMLSHYEVYSDLIWYQRRGGQNGALARSLLLNWSEMLHPATPHIAEELWATAGGEGLIATHIIDFDDEEKSNLHILARELFIHSTIDQARQMKELAERHLDGRATSMTIQCAEAWKGKLVRTGIELLENDFPMKGAMGEIMSRPFAQDGEVRGLIPGAWKRIMKQLYRWSPAERSVLKANLDEIEILQEAVDFIRAELGVEDVSIYLSGEGEDVGGKAKFSFPGEPGIAYL